MKECCHGCRAAHPSPAHSALRRTGHLRREGLPYRPARHVPARSCDGWVVVPGSPSVVDEAEAHPPLVMGERFHRFASGASRHLGTPHTFVWAILVIVVWALTGPLFAFSDTWQLVINTGTTIVTFLMVFLLQNTQNRDSLAIQLKLDELLRGVKGARTGLVKLETLTEEELVGLESEFEALQRSRQSGPAGPPGKASA